MTDSSHIQIQFLQRIEDLVPKKTSLVFELSECLDISTDSAYRRMRGETLLTIDEIIKLCNAYNISFDAFSKVESGMVTFKYNNPEPTLESFIRFLQGLHNDLTKIASDKNSKILYAAEDIPVFHHYGYYAISAFKIFYWLKSVINLPELANSKFKTDINNPEIIDLAKKVYDLYSQIYTIEIWTENTVISTLKQIEYYWESGMFETKEEALEVCNSVKKELLDIQIMAEHSSKLYNEVNTLAEKNYDLYFSDVEITNNCVLVDMPIGRSVYLGHFSFYTMNTNNEAYCQKTYEWLQSIIKKSTLISSVSEKHRYRFFKNIFHKTDNLIDKITSDN